MKYILVTGGVISGVGKGIISSSFGTILKSSGLEVTSIKIDPYLNVDAGTFSPYEHGEVYVLDDGGEVDLDLGNYERFLDVTLHRDNNITTGKVYKNVIDAERRGDKYLGKTVQVVPHITDAIQEWVVEVAQKPVSSNGKTPDVCIIELGGTIGDIESMAFVEAFRQFQFRVGNENICVAHVSLVPQPRSTGEHKTKPTQASVKELRGLGLSPDIIICRSEKPFGDSVKEKISNFCHVNPKQILSIPDLSTIYEVPVLMENYGMTEYLNERLNLGIPSHMVNRTMKKWRSLVERIKHLKYEVNIVIVGKYTELEDAYASLVKALQHASNHLGYKTSVQFIEASELEKETLLKNPVAYHDAWGNLCKGECVVVPGGFGERGVEGKIAACKWCRDNNKPFLGICLGFQAAVIEFARNVAKLDGAHSTECEKNPPHPVIIEMPEHNTGQMGGTMRLGKRTTVFRKELDSKMRHLYKSVEKIEERHRHRYEVNPEYVEKLEKLGLHFVGVDTDKKRMEILELQDHPYYVAVQFHPEYLSRPLAPSPPFVGLILAAKGKLSSYIAKGLKLSPQAQSDYSDSDDSEKLNVNESDSSSAYSSSSIL